MNETTTKPTITKFRSQNECRSEEIVKYLREEEVLPSSYSNIMKGLKKFGSKFDVNSIKKYR